MGIIISILFNACKKDDDTPPVKATSPIYATLSDGSGHFSPLETTPYPEALTFEIPYYYPEESDNVSDLTKVKLRANSPATVTFSDGTSVDEIDLSKETTIVINKGDGTSTTHTVSGVIVKSSEAAILSFRLPDVDIDGYISEEDKLVGIYAGKADVTAQKPMLTFSPHATISPDTSLVQDYSQPVTYTITAHDGTEVEYTVQTVEPNKVASGIRSGSGKLLWNKSFYYDMTVSTTENVTSMAVDDNYFVVNYRDGDNKYFNRFTGEYVGNMTDESGLMSSQSNASLCKFFAANDEAGHILITNLTTGAGQTHYIARWDSINDPNPTKFLSWTSDLSYQIGRKMSITGDIDGDAMVYIGLANSNMIARWEVVGGELQSEEPEIIGTGIENAWTLYGNAMAIGPDSESNIFLSSMKGTTDGVGNLVYMNPNTQEVLAEMDVNGAGFERNHAIDYKEFNNAKYLSVFNLDNKGSKMNAMLFNVTTPTAISDYSSSLVYKSEPVDLYYTTVNLSGEVALKVSDDGYSMIMYVMGTRGGVAAYEFDCIDYDNFF